MVHDRIMAGRFDKNHWHDNLFVPEAESFDFDGNGCYLTYALTMPNGFPFDEHIHDLVARRCASLYRAIADAMASSPGSATGHVPHGGKFDLILSLRPPSPKAPP